jgi:hypothetical protein
MIRKKLCVLFVGCSLSGIAIDPCSALSAVLAARFPTDSGSILAKIASLPFSFTQMGIRQWHSTNTCWQTNLKYLVDSETLYLLV